MTTYRLFQKNRTHKPWLALALLATLISTLVLFIPQVQAVSTLDEEIIAAPQPQNQFFNDDVTVEKGQVLDGDVFVYGGDIEVEEDGLISGDLIVLSGGVVIQEGGQVLGDLADFSGDVNIKGEVQGDVASLSGDVSIDKGAIVHGDVSVVSGKIKRHREAEILGNVVEGPNIQLQMPTLPNVPGFNLSEETQPEIEISHDSGGTGFFGWLFGGFLRLLFAILVAVGLAAFVGIITISRPEFVEESAATIKQQLALSFGVGLVTNIVLLVISTFLIATFCLAIIAIVPILGLIVLGILSWTGISLLVGHRVVRYANISAKSATTAAMGALAMALPIAIFWSFGGCFRFVSFLLLLAISSAGSGAFILPWLRKVGGNSPSGTTPAPSAPAPLSSKVATEDALPRDEASQVASEQKHVDGGETDGLIDASTETAFDGARPDAKQIDTKEADPKQDDFTRIRGIGPTFSRRLAAANIRTFAQLAALSAEEISEILGWSAERVVRDNLIAQANELAVE